jgi:hypothetical protein
MYIKISNIDIKRESIKIEKLLIAVAILPKGAINFPCLGDWIRVHN